MALRLLLVSMRNSPIFFSILYFVQGAILAYVSNFQKPYLSSSNVSLAAIATLTTLMIIPFIIKIFFGMLSDRVSLLGKGHRRPYMLIGLSIGAACFLSLLTVSPGENFTLFSALMITATFGMALFDTATDGFAIDLNRERDNSEAIQSYMMAGKSLGYIALSSAFGYLAGSVGYRSVFATLAGLIVVVFIWVLAFARESSSHSETLTANRDSKSPGFFRELGWPAVIFAAYAVFYSVLSFGIDGIITLFLHRTLHFESTEIGFYGSARGVGAICGAVLAGLLSKKIGIAKTSYCSLILLTISAAILSLINSPSTALLLGGLWGLAWAFQETVFLILAMRLSEQALAATAFAFLMIFSNIGTAVGEGLATTLSGFLGFEKVFLGFGILSLAIIPLVHLLFRRAPRLKSLA